MRALDGKRVAMLIGPGFEDSEAIYPYYRLQEEGARVDIVGVGEAGTMLNGKHGVPMRLDHSVSNLKCDTYDALVIPGGRGPDAIRANPAVTQFTRAFFDARKPVAAICHGPQVLISAGVLKNVQCTCYVSVADDVRNAGARFEDREVVVDNDAKLITSRHPGDLPAWMQQTILVFQEG